MKLQREHPNRNSTKAKDGVHSQEHSIVIRKEYSRGRNCCILPTEHASCRTSSSMTLTFGDRLRAISPVSALGMSDHLFGASADSMRRSMSLVR